MNKRETFFRHLGDFFFPRTCLFCAEPIPIGGECSCEGLSAASRLTGSLRATYCSLQRDTPSLDMVVSSYKYEGVAAAAIKRYKFKSAYDGAELLADVMVADALDFPEYSGFDYALGVPDFSARSLHAGKLAEAVAKKLGIVFRGEVLKKVRRTRKQHDLSAEERGANLSGAFAVPSFVALKDKKLLLIDDIITGGSTLEECAKTLKAAGADKVFALTFCSASHSRSKK